MMFYTYVIRSKKDGKNYTGSTKDLRKRLQEHNENKVFSTKGRGPFKLIYFEGCVNEQDARIREKYLKTGMGKRYLKNRLKRFLSLTGFTLIELLVVVAIIGSLVLLSLPRFRGTFNNLIFDNFCQNLAQRLRYLEERAYVEQNMYLLNFDLANRIIEIKLKDKTSGNFIDVKGLLGRKIIIPNNIQIETSTLNILFLPDGAIQGKDIKISGFQSTAAIFINESLGSIKLEKNA